MDFDYKESWYCNTTITIKTITIFYNSVKKNSKNQDITDGDIESFKTYMIGGLEDLYTDFKGKCHIYKVHTGSNIVLYWPTWELCYVIIDEKYGLQSNLNPILGSYGVISIKDIDIIKELNEDNLSSFYNINEDGEKPLPGSIEISIFTYSMIANWYENYSIMNEINENSSFIKSVSNEQFNEYIHKIFYLNFLVRCLPLRIGDHNYDTKERYSFFLHQINQKIYDYSYIMNLKTKSEIKLEMDKVYSFFDFILDDDITDNLLKLNNTFKKRKLNHDDDE